MTIKLLPASEYTSLLHKIQNQINGNQRLIPVDASWYLPNIPRDPYLEFQKSRIPNSIFFDIDKIKDSTSPYPHMLPSLDEFNSAMSQLGVKENDVIVVYDRLGNFSAPRVAWTFQTFGHKEVYLLDNFPEYIKLKLPIDETSSNVEHSQYKATKIDKKAIVSFEEFYQIVTNKFIREQYNIFDARAKGRFIGKDPEPRPELSSGHAPGVKSLSFDRVLDSETKRFLTVEKMRHLLLNELQFDIGKPTIVMCGTGVSACILKTALDVAGFNNVQVYDGSWTEYVQRVSKDLIIKEDI